MEQFINYDGVATSRIIELPAKIVKGNYQLIVTDGSSRETVTVVVQ